MKITLPSIEVNESKGFSDEIDIFRRKGFGERLTNLFKNTDEELVVALNSPWGEGKSTFIKMWQGHVNINNSNELKTIYFDSFKNDYQKDPFLAITSEIYSNYSMNDESQKKFIENTKKVAKSLARGSLKIGTKILTSGLVDDSFLENNENDISSLVNNNIDNIIENRLKNHKADKNALDKFKNDLEGFIENETPLIFIIDELDRCRPDFALELLEQIKHLFSVKNLHFLLVVNSEQLEASIKSKYGNDINASKYLQKFINISLELPKIRTQYDDYNKTFMNWALSKMLNEGETIRNENLIETIEEITKLYNPSFREIERTLSNISILHNMSPKTKSVAYYQIATAFVCFIKVSNPKVFQLLKHKESTPDEIFIKSELNKIPNNDTYSEFYFLNLVKQLIIFDYAEEEERKTLLNKNNNIKELFRESYIFQNRHSSLFKEIIENLSTLNLR